MNTIATDIRSDFPILSREVNGKPLIYLDNAASTQKPTLVIDAVKNYYETINANVHRGNHLLSQLATDAVEQARDKTQAFINAAEREEIIFTKGTTDGINTIASSMTTLVKPGQNVVISALEHHSNIVPWQMLCERTGAMLRVIPINQKGEWILEEGLSLIDENTAIVAVNHISNALGTINPVKTLIEHAHRFDVPVLIDGAQSAPHMAVDVQDLDADFYCFSAHKICGPTGIGVLYGKRKHLEALPPYQGGGEMIKTVSFEKTTYAELPFKFEAGTPNMAGIVGMGAAIDYLTAHGMSKLKAIEDDLLHYATEKMSAIEGMRFYGTADKKASVISFLIDGIHPYDLGTLMDKFGVAVRTGHHCTQPLMDFYNIPGTVRASFAFYNNKNDVDVMVEAIEKSAAMLR
ncbi:MAG: cysteine desulfurase [Cryomorphaceae bacterium]|nr:cysteine desulfurase [Cryomorphaceae bacterium]